MIKRLLLATFIALAPITAWAAGTIFGLPLSQQLDSNGDPMSGAKLYIYDAGTSTPVDAFEDFSLTTGLELPHPIVADSAGRLPEFWLADGSYRVRLTDAAGNEIFDISSVTALGASSGTGGGGGSTVSDESIFQTGDIMWQPINGVRTGWVRANGRTIGSAASGAVERANADVEALFEFLWNNFSNSLCAVSGGRGANAAADWAANKTITTLDMRGRLAYGMDTMGNSAASVVAAATSAGGALGQEELAISQANLPNVSFSDTLVVDAHTHSGPSHTHTGPSHTHSVSITSGAGSAHSHSAGTYAVGTSLTGASGLFSGGNDVDGVQTGGGEDNLRKNMSTNNPSLASGAVSGTSSSESLHTHSVSGTSGAEGTGFTGASGTGNTGAASSSSISGSVSSGGSGTAFDTLSPGRAGSWYFRL